MSKLFFIIITSTFKVTRKRRQMLKNTLFSQYNSFSRKTKVRYILVQLINLEPEPQPIPRW